jgi:hypothetical protein
MTNDDDLSQFTSVKKAFDEWGREGSTNILRLNNELLESLFNGGYIVNEKIPCKGSRRKSCCC